MGKAVHLASGALGGATTLMVRAATRRVMHQRNGAPRVPRAARRRSGLGTMLLWASAVGVLLAMADVFTEQRKASAPAGV